MSKINNMGTSALTTLITLTKTGLAGKVDKVDGKGLSTNDYTSEEKTKLAGIEEGANKTVVVDNLTSTDAASALSANQGKVLDEKIAAINTSLSGMGSGDMTKAAYDTDNDGVVDNAAKLGGQAPSYYAAAADVPTKVSQLTNDSGFRTAAQVTRTIEGYGFQTAKQVDDAINAKISSTYKAAGSTAFASLPAADEDHLGLVYNVTDAFTTTDAFLEGAGKNYPAGTNVAVVIVEESHLTISESGIMLNASTGDPISVSIRALSPAYNFPESTPDEINIICENTGSGMKYYSNYEHIELDPRDGELKRVIRESTVPAVYGYDVLSGFVDLSGYVASGDLQEMTGDEVTSLWNSVTA